MFLEQSMIAKSAQLGGKRHIIWFGVPCSVLRCSMKDGNGVHQASNTARHVAGNMAQPINAVQSRPPR